jgi:hypothetical protein
VIERVNSSCGKMKEYDERSSEMEEQVRDI